MDALRVATVDDPGLPPASNHELFACCLANGVRLQYTMTSMPIFEAPERRRIAASRAVARPMELRFRLWH